jgi:hypothetical protein
MTWPQVVFGWPAIIAGLLLFTLAFGRERSTLGFLALLFVVPFLWYASRAPGGIWFSGIALVTLAAAAWLLYRGRRGWAAACVAPFAAWVIVLAVHVATQ